MSNEQDKLKHSKRLHQKTNYIKQQVDIAKAHGVEVKAGQEHRLAKHSATTCGDSHCVMCGNPRKFFKEPTIAEKSFDQTQKWSED
jgi:hypothetical protein